MTYDKKNSEKKDKEANISFYKDGYSIAANSITDFGSLTPLFKGMQEQYTAVSKLTQSFAQRVHREKRPIQCEKGCNWCCFQPVYITTQEAILIYEFMSQSLSPEIQRMIKTNVHSKFKKTKGLTEEKKQTIRHACPFLIEGNCSVYPVRPMACRIYLSSNVSSCKWKYDHPTEHEVIPALYDFMLRAGRYMNEGFVGYLKGNGRKMDEHTVEEFMTILFKDPGFAEKWLKESQGSLR